MNTRPYAAAAGTLMSAVMAFTVACSSEPDESDLDENTGGTDEPYGGAGQGASGGAPGGTGGMPGGTGGEPGGTGGGGQAGSGGTNEPPPEPEVCYPGPDGDYIHCVGLVPWSASWGDDYEYLDHSSPQYTAPIRFVDLSVADPALPIAKNFVLEEVMQEWKGRYGVFQPHVVVHLQTIRDRIGGALHINSGYRSPGYNRSVGGATYSRHMYGDAADMWSSEISVTGMGNICDELGAGYVGLYESFTHCDWRNDPLEPAFFAEIFPTSAEMPVHTGELVRAPDGNSWRAPATGFDEGEPLRIWTAYDADGNVVDEQQGRQYEPPARAARLHVRVGGQLDLETVLSP